MINSTRSRTVLAARGYPQAAAGLVSPDHRFAIMSLTAAASPAVAQPQLLIESKAFWAELTSALPRLLPAGVSGVATGEAVVSWEGNKQLSTDALAAEYITLVCSSN